MCLRESKDFCPIKDNRDKVNRQIPDSVKIFTTFKTQRGEPGWRSR